jgi:thioredoxin 1
MTKSILKIAFFLLFTISVASCAQEAKTSGASNPITSLNAPEFQQKLTELSGGQIIDVRTPEEFKGGHISNATNIDIYDPAFESKIAGLDKSKPVFVYCKGGGRSADAAEKFQQLGFPQIYDMKGGIMAWANKNLPIETNQTAQADKFLRADYDKLLSSHDLVLIDYYAPWCGPCKKMEPTLSKLSQEFSGKVEIVRINVDEASALAKELQIENIPVITTFKKGQQIQMVSGMQTEEQLRSLIDGLLK